MGPLDKRDANGGNVRSLHQAIRAAKIAAADRNDVVVDLRDADRARLELLFEDLKGVIADIPNGDDQFDFALSSGLEPRLWVDATSHVKMGRDRRTYRFLRDTRLGRIVLAETDDRAKIADKVTAYVADRIVERQRLMDGPVDLPAGMAGGKPARRLVPEDRSWDGFVTGLLWFLVGMLIGGFVALAWLWNRIV